MNGYVCGKQLARQGHKDLAMKLLTKLIHLREATEHIHLAAMLQVIRLQSHDGLGHDGIGLLTKALASDDKKKWHQGLRTARLIDKAEASKVAREVLKDSDPSRAALLLTLLGDLEDDASLSIVVDSMGSDYESIQIAALGAMALLGGAEHVSLLVDAAARDSKAAAVALKTLVSLPGEDMDQGVLGLLEDPSLQDTVIRFIGKRRISSAVPKLVAMIDAPNRLQVVAALGETISLDELDILGKRLDSKPEDFHSAIRKALHTACGRMPNRSATEFAACVATCASHVSFRCLKPSEWRCAVLRCKRLNGSPTRSLYWRCSSGTPASNRSRSRCGMLPQTWR